MTETALETLRSLTEVGGSLGSQEQVRRLVNRYEWAAPRCVGRDVVEVACGAGIGLGVLRARARSLVAGDIVPATVNSVRRHYSNRVKVECFPADAIPVPTASVDVIILFEALYYLPSFSAFLAEVRRALRPDGELLLATANKDLPDFTPSPASSRYLGVAELSTELREAGFSTEFWGDVDTSAVSARQRVLRPLKAAASRLDLIPRTLAGREFLKRIFFGRLVPLPVEITESMFTGFVPTAVPAGRPDRHFKVLLCRASLCPSTA
jgi:SAM-dependent methyltransferase